MYRRRKVDELGLRAHFVQVRFCARPSKARLSEVFVSPCAFGSGGSYPCVKLRTVGV